MDFSGDGAINLQDGFFLFPWQFTGLYRFGSLFKYLCGWLCQYRYLVVSSLTNGIDPIFDQCLEPILPTPPSSHGKTPRPMLFAWRVAGGFTQRKEHPALSRGMDESPARFYGDLIRQEFSKLVKSPKLKFWMSGLAQLDHWHHIHGLGMFLRWTDRYIRYQKVLGYKQDRTRCCSDGVCAELPKYKSYDIWGFHIAYITVNRATNRQVSLNKWQWTVPVNTMMLLLYIGHYVVCCACVPMPLGLVRENQYLQFDACLRLRKSAEGWDAIQSYFQVAPWFSCL